MERHGMRGTKVYIAWKHMKSRCCNPNNKDYAHYAGRGITVCEEWKNSFIAFYRDVGDPPSSKHSLDRIDTLKGYFPGNCRWATSVEQNNNRFNNRKIEYGGRVQNLSQWAEEVGITDKLLDKRLRDGWSVERALTEPVNRRATAITYKGRTLSLPEWSEVLGVPKSRLKSRLDRGWPVTEAFEVSAIPKELVALRREQVKNGLLKRERKKVPSG